MAQLAAPGGNPIISSMAGTFTVPKTLAVKAPAYSIAQIALIGGNADIELGWIVSPGTYHGSKAPHLFVFFRRALGTPACQEGLAITSLNPQCPSSDYKKLSPKYYADMTISGSAFFYVGYDSTDNYWYIQYQNQYIAKMSEKWWTSCGAPLGICSNFKSGDNAEWYGEVYTPSSNGSYPCTPMGNGYYGTSPHSASVSGMEYGTGGPKLLTAKPLMLPPTYGLYWDTNRLADEDFSSSFRFGGPGNC
jgi:hypothetical protein